MPQKFTTTLLTSCLSVALALVAAMQPAAAVEAFAGDVPSLPAPPSINGTVDDSWMKALKLPVLFDFTYQRSGEPTTVYVAQDAQALDLAFQVTQQHAITENAQTNGTGVLNDDSVTVVLWPQGAGGFEYTFSANANGARYQTSSENSAYSPEWSAAARRTSSGYTVTMRIPFRIMRAGGSTAWKAQFERTIQSTNSTQVWEHETGQRNAGEVAYAGTLTGVAVAGATRRTAARLQVYGLGEATNAENGGNTSRVGADLAIPVTATSSFLASFHPDYSNVEIDQQTISPSTFQRSYSEVRPFFTQLSHSFNDTISCTDCPMLLYTPAIPTFREGYAYEGTQGRMNFAAFDAVGTSRTDDAQVLDYTINDQNRIASASLQRVAVHLPVFDDVTTSVTSGYNWQKSHTFVYLNAATDRGTNVTDSALGNYLEYGGGYVDKDTVYGMDYQEVGPQFLPADGFVQQPDVYGVSVFYNRTIHFAPDKPLQDIQVNNFFNDQHDHLGNAAYKVWNTQINFDLRKQLTLHVYGGYGKNETFDAQYLPFNQNGVLLGYKTQTTTPSSIQYSAGPYYHGSLRSWSYIATLPLMRRLNLSLETDENTYAPGGTYVAIEPIARQWLERVGLDWQFNRYASFDIGARRIIGRNLPNAFQAPDLPANGEPCGTQNGSNPFDCIDAGNVSAAFHFLAAHNEWYVAYGNPNNLSTLPAFYVKWIRYIGAEKGT